MDNIYTLKNYGKVEITLKDVLEKKDVSRNKLCTMIAPVFDTWWQKNLLNLDKI